MNRVSIFLLSEKRKIVKNDKIGKDNFGKNYCKMSE